MNDNLFALLITTAIALIIAIAARRFSLWQARDGRKCDFSAFLRQWRHEVESFVPNPVQPHINPVVAGFAGKVKNLMLEAAKVRNTFFCKKRFDVLTQRLVDLEQAGWNQKPPREAILEALNELIEFVSVH